MAEQRLNLKSFVFIGECTFGKEPVKTGESDKGEWKRISLGAKVDNSVGFAELFGMKRDIIKTFSKGDNDKKGEVIDVEWDDRFNGEVVDNVANFRKIFINLGERKEFIAEWDAIEYLESKLEDIKGKNIVITGQLQAQSYKGKTQLKPVLSSIRLAKEDEKSALITNQTIYFNKDSLDESEFKKTNRAYINGWVKDYSSESKGDMFYPYTFVIDTNNAKANPNIKPEHIEKITNFILSQFKVKGKSYYELGFECRWIYGAEKKEITYEDLTPYQQTQLDMGIIDLPTIAKQMGGSIYGEKHEEIRLIRPHGRYADGAIETQLTDDDFAPVVKEKEVNVNKIESDIADEIVVDDLPFADIF